MICDICNTLIKNITKCCLKGNDGNQPMVININNQLPPLQVCNTCFVHYKRTSRIFKLLKDDITNSRSSSSN